MGQMREREREREREKVTDQRAPLSFLTISKHRSVTFHEACKINNFEQRN